MAVNMTCGMHANALQCHARPNTILLDCMSYLTQYLYGSRHFNPALHIREHVFEIRSVKENRLIAVCHKASDIMQ